MGHSINFMTASKNANRKEILADIREEVMYEDWQEGGSYHDNLTWHEDRVYRDKDEAHDAIEKFDNGWYSDHAVLFHDTSELKETAKMKQIEARIADATKKMEEAEKASKITNRKSDTITCPHCHSRIALAYYRGFCNCPVCGTDMRAQSTITRIDNHKKKINALREQLRAEKLKACEKAPVKWLIKYEYHI